ncbi:hypothetical protein GETHPA_28790 [Geothrix rubra]|uniref:Uncharacterized protein n=1 Tax=Geothrix rubra TaxID=2927977 RepID=A0ABQ5QA75_9BACT|nr:hypothetical protein [Geothrix rubra]GLH71346.1 hypothetical protein GETHPA_28790 [Geothrix rubra]
MPLPLSKRRLRAAWIVAVAVDAIQIPVEATGLLGWIVGAGLDVVTMAVLWALVGFHWAFLPSFLTEWIPYLDYAPLWTLAVLIATRGRGQDSMPAPTLPPHP